MGEKGALVSINIVFLLAIQFLIINCHKIKIIEISHCILFLQLSSMGDPQCDVRKIVGAFDARILPYRGHGQQYQTSSISGMRRSIIIEHVINSYYSFSKL